MGLDMYMTAKYYYGGQYIEGSDQEHTLEIDGDFVENNKIDVNNITDISTQVAYWRKANHIHRWFVHNIQRGQDDKKEYIVPKESLEELAETCKAAIRAYNDNDHEKVNYLLPPGEGFYFGSTEIDQWYLKDTKYTLEICNKLLETNDDADYYYRSCW
tara:strand:+ start:343 stop:816 length:474 start_codon:yes stop_codon:yes gene_type:complete